MSLGVRLARLERMRAARRSDPMTLAAIRADPAAVLTLAGITPDKWQAALLRTLPDETLALTGRQNGKSTTAAGCCLATALTGPGRTVLIASPTLRQSVECYRKVVELYDRLGRPVPPLRVNATFLELGNGSRVIALPGDERTIRGFSSPALVVVDEGARTKDALLTAVRPMLAVSRGKLLAVSTPFGRRGWFFKAWEEGGWHTVKVTSADCTRITPAFLERERRTLGDLWFRQEHLAEFNADVNAVFSHEDVMKAMDAEVKPLFPFAAA